MIEPDFDINVEYEKLFGTAKRVNLFDEDENYYNLIRPSIVASECRIYHRNLLPFPTIRLQSYINSLNLLELLDDILYSKKRRFCLEVEGVCKAFGDYESETNSFIICQDSLISNQITSILMDDVFVFNRERFIKQVCVKDGGFYRMTRDFRFSSASLAATYVLGRRVNGWLAWKNFKGETLKNVCRKEA